VQIYLENCICTCAKKANDENSIIRDFDANVSEHAAVVTKHWIPMTISNYERDEGLSLALTRVILYCAEPTGRRHANSFHNLTGLSLLKEFSQTSGDV
jgi:hypothetical protein